jgi:tetratricopeptide (TPR) repeat protein
LEKALELSKKEGLKRHEIYVYKGLGNYYFQHKEYYNAIKYYFEACEIIKKLALQVPEEYRINFMRTSNNMHPFRQLMEINKIYNSRSHGTAWMKLLQPE